MMVRAAFTVFVTCCSIAPNLRALPADAAISGRSLGVELQAGLSAREYGKTEALAMLSVSLPLDRLARGTQDSRIEVSSRRALDQLAMNGDIDASASDDLETPGATHSARAGTAAPGFETETNSTEHAADASTSRFAQRGVLTPEFARATITAALSAQGYAARGQRLEGSAARARGSAAVPEVRLRAARIIDDSVRLAPTADDPYRYVRSAGVNLLLEARLTWKLDRLVFAGEELGIERLLAQHAAGRQELANRVVKALVAWQAAQIRASAAEPGSEAEALAQLEKLQAELNLDTWTAGWFSERARQVQKAAETAAARAPAHAQKPPEFAARVASTTHANADPSPAHTEAGESAAGPAAPSPSQTRPALAARAARAGAKRTASSVRDWSSGATRGR